MKYRHLVAFVALGAMSCSDATDPKTALRDVQITPAVAAVHIGDTLVLQPALFSQAGTQVPGHAFSWSSSNTAIATVDGSGVLRAKALGRTVIAATTDGITGYATFDVVTVGYNFFPDTNRILVGDTRQLFAHWPPGPNGDPAIIFPDAVWTSSDSSVARVNATGLVTGLKSGHATITANYHSETVRGEVYVVRLPKLHFVSHSGSCGITDAQEMYCWGRLDNMSLAEPPDQCGYVFRLTGPSNFTRYRYRCSATPVRVSTPVPFVSFVPGSQCAYDASRRAYCSIHGPTGYAWQLYGNGQEFLSIEDNCAITPAHDAVCTGNNFDGALGIGNFKVFTPDTTVTVPGGFQWKQTTADGGRCGLTLDGVAYCWGPDAHGELGFGNAIAPSLAQTPSYSSPAPVKTNLRFTQLKMAFGFTCGLTTDQLLYCWGLLPGRNGAQSGFPTVVDSTVRFRSLTMDVGAVFICGIASNERSYCFGNASGYFPVARPNPSAFGPDVAIKSIDSSNDHVCGIGRDEILYCWGTNVDGGLGSGSYDPTSAVVRVIGQ